MGRLVFGQHIPPQDGREPHTLMGGPHQGMLQLNLACALALVSAILRFPVAPTALGAIPPAELLTNGSRPRRSDSLTYDTIFSFLYGSGYGGFRCHFLVVCSVWIVFLYVAHVFHDGTYGVRGQKVLFNRHLGIVHRSFIKENRCMMVSLVLVLYSRKGLSQMSEHWDEITGILSAAHVAVSRAQYISVRLQSILR